MRKTNEELRKVLRDQLEERNLLKKEEQRQNEDFMN